MEQTTWNVVYHATLPQRVVSDEDKANLLATGEWFDHPSKVNKGNEHGQIRRKSKQGKGNSKYSSEKA